MARFGFGEGVDVALWSAVVVEFESEEDVALWSAVVVGFE
jgi:hypothetical protein